MIEKCYVIPVEKACNADCVFCISKSRNYDKGSPLMVIDDKLVENIKLLKRRNIKKFEITGGGEPFLHHNLDVIVNLIKEIIPDAYIKIYTNGNILRNIPNIDEIDISVCHYNNDINNIFMNSNVDINVLDKLKFFRNNNDKLKIRLSIPLIRGSIDNSKKLEEFINITDKYVNEYVVRTLYPGTKNIEDLYIDFDYKKDNVIFERDNNISDFDGLILWSDGNFYKNWNLDNKRYLKSYLLLKSDARTYINEIENIINSENFVIEKRLLLNDFMVQCEKFYCDKNAEYLKLIKRHLLNLSYLFGNEGMIFILDSEDSINDLYIKTFKLKEKIRQMYSFTHSMNGFISRDGVLSHINLVHCPDADINLFDRDLSYIESMNLKEISDEEFKLVKKYRSFNI